MAGSTGFSGTERVLLFGAMILMTIQTTYLVFSAKHFGLFKSFTSFKFLIGNPLGDKDFIKKSVVNFKFLKTFLLLTKQFVVNQA